MDTGSSLYPCNQELRLLASTAGGTGSPPDKGTNIPYASWHSQKKSNILKNKMRHYHLSKFHIYVLVYCNGLYLSGLLHSVQWAPVSSISLELIQMNSF